jgi:Right handed beta helix region
MKLIKMLASLLALSTICMSDLYATIIHVPADYPTISSAVSAASPGDTIIAAAGVYNEHVVINVANLTLLGAQANVDARTRTYIPANESIITFATPAYGTGIVNIASPNVIFNGFTVRGNGTTVNSTAAIFAGDVGQFLPSTTTIDVTGLRLLNNIVQNNANGILIASIEPTSKTPNYLVQFNYLQNNSGDPSSGSGQGVFFSNSAGSAMRHVTVTDNLFDGMETSSSVNLSNVTTATVSYNKMNQDNSIALFGTTGVSITRNDTSGATGTGSSTASAIFVGFGNSNTTITDNLINTATGNGISIFDGNSNITITENCIVGNSLAGISLKSEGSANSNISINNNNIRMNTTGLNLDPGSYASPPPLLDASSNYWNSALGPNYNGTSPGAGDLITDKNIPSTQTVLFTPFLTDPIMCPGTQTLSVTAPPSVVVSQRLATVTVTASSGLPVTLTSTTPTVCSVSGTGPAFTVALLGTGTCTLIASQAGNANFAPVSTTVTLLVLAAAEPVPVLDNKLLITLGLLLGLIGFMRLRRA